MVKMVVFMLYTFYQNKKKLKGTGNMGQSFPQGTGQGLTCQSHAKHLVAVIAIIITVFRIMSLNVLPSCALL